MSVFQLRTFFFFSISRNNNLPLSRLISILSNGFPWRNQLTWSSTISIYSDPFKNIGNCHPLCIDGVVCPRAPLVILLGLNHWSANIPFVRYPYVWNCILDLFPSSGLHDGSCIVAYELYYAAGQHCCVQQIPSVGLSCSSSSSSRVYNT